MKLPVSALPFFFSFSFSFFFSFFFSFSLWSQTTPSETDPVRLVLVENSDLNPGENRLHYPLLITEKKGYRIRCLSQQDEESVIRGLGFLVMPSVVLDPLSEDVVKADPEGQPFLCPYSPQYPIKLYRHNPGTGEQFYLHFPKNFQSRAFGDALYIVGCNGLFKALNLDTSRAINADPTPFFGDQIYKIQCLSGAPITLRPKTFKEWCLKKDLTPFQKHTVQMLLSRTPQGPAALGQEEECTDADAFLMPLKSLDLRDMEIMDAGPLAVLKNLTRLLAAGNPMGDLKPLSELTNLAFLDLSACKLRQINALAGLTQLVELNLSRNGLSDIRALSSLPVLEKLDLSTNQIGDPAVVSLGFLSTLKQLNLQNNQITNPSPLKDLALLINLNLAKNKISSTEYLRDFPPTTQINLAENPLETKNFESLCALNRHAATPQGHTIRQLMDYVQATDCSRAGEKLKPMAQMVLANKGLTDLSPLVYFNQIRSLDLSDNQIQWIEILGKNLTQLISLNVSRNQIKFLGDLGPFTQLADLKIEGNPIEHDSFFTWCTFKSDKEKVEVQHVPTVERLLEKANTNQCLKANKVLSALRDLDLRGKGIIGVGPIGDLPNLDLLLLTKNAIRDVAPLKKLKKISSLYLGENQIDSFQEFYFMKSLVQLDLSDNPITEINPPNVPMDPPFMEGLTHLMLKNTKITRLSNLDYFAKLIYVDMMGMNLGNPGSFTDYCLIHKFNGPLTNPHKQTMKALMNFMANHQYLPPSCGAAESWLVRKNLIDVRNNNLTDPAPLVSLFYEKMHLDLRNNNLTDKMMVWPVLMQLHYLKTQRSEPTSPTGPRNPHEPPRLRPRTAGVYLQGNPVCIGIAHPGRPNFPLEPHQFPFDYYLGVACNEAPPQ